MPVDQGELPFPHSELETPIRVKQRRDDVRGSLLEPDTDEIEYFLVRLGGTANPRQIVNELRRYHLRLPDWHRISLLEREHQVVGFIAGPLLQLPKLGVVAAYRKEGTGSGQYSLKPECRYDGNFWFVGILNSEENRDQ